MTRQSFSAAALMLTAALMTNQPAVVSGQTLIGDQPVPQVVPDQVLSLEKALEMAKVTSERITIARADVSRAEGSYLRARSERFPQFGLTASYERALASEFSGLFDSSAPPCDPFSPDPGQPLDDRVTEIERALDCGAIGGGFGSTDLNDLPFGRQNTYSVNVSFAQNLFSGGRIGAQTDIAEAGRETAQVGVSSAQAQLALDVARAFFDAALTSRLLTIAEATFRQADSTAGQTELSWQAGRLPEFEVLRARVTRDNLRPVVIRRRADRELALLRLKQLLDLPLQSVLAVEADLESEVLPPPAPFASAFQDVTRGAESLPRAPVRQAEIQIRAQEAGVAVARSGRRPTLNVTSRFGRIGYPGNLTPFNADFHTNWTVGANLQFPLFTGGRLRGDEMIARADLEQTQARLQQTRELATLDTQSAFEELEAAGAAWEASAGTVQQATRAHEIAELRFKEGISTQLELSDARLQLEQAQANRAVAARDLQVARARVALLPDLPLSGGPVIELAQSPRGFMPSQVVTPAGAATGASGGADGTTGVPQR